MATSPKEKASPKKWSSGELLSDARAATIAFRNERVNEPLDLYNRFFDEFATIFAELIAHLLDGKSQQKAFRYLTAPPISADDLATIADANLTPSRLRVDSTEA